MKNFLFKITILSIIMVQMSFGYSSLGVENTQFKTLSDTIMESNIIYIPIMFFITIFIYNIYKWCFVYGIYSSVEKNKVSEKKYENKRIETNELIELKNELNFIINQNFKSNVLKERIESLLTNFETRYIENKNILNNLKINTNEKEIAINENIKIIENIKEIIKTTKIKKEEINLMENTEEIRKYLNLWEKI